MAMTDQTKALHTSYDFSTSEGRSYLYETWATNRIASGALEAGRTYTIVERSAFFADWLSSLIAEGKLDPGARLPSYEQLAALPFALEKQDIAQVIRQLREAKVLPLRRTRKDANTPQWTNRDQTVLHFIGEMRAIRFDQLQRLLSRESTDNLSGRLLSPSRTCRIIDRYERAKLVVYQRVYYRGPGWIYLTRQGLKEVGLDYRAEPPSSRFLEHLAWINDVRLHLEAIYPGMRWISERAIQAQQTLRVRGRRLPHIPDGILVLEHSDGREDRIDIEVQVSKPSPREIEYVMSSGITSGSSNPLWYYVTRKAQGIVRAVYEQMNQNRKAMRPAIEIFDLEP